MTGSEPIRISWSRLRTHSECPQKGKLVAEGRKSAVTDVRVFFPGTVADRCMRKWLSVEPGQVPEPGWMAAHVDEIIEQEEKTARETGDGIVKWKSLSDKQEVRAYIRQAVNRLEHDLAVHCLPYDWDPAVRFNVPLVIPHPAGHQAEIILTGEMDLLTRRPEGLVVWDLKLTRDTSYWRKTLGQLLFYEIAAWGMTKQWPWRSGLLQPMCADTAPWWEFTQEHRVQMFNRIVAVAADIWTGRLDPTPSRTVCGSCYVRHACPLYGSGRGRVPWPSQGAIA